MKLKGRVLHLFDRPELLRAQLEGSPAADHDAYHYGVNTDAMISGRACTLAPRPPLTRHTHTHAAPLRFLSHDMLHARLHTLALGLS